jgi:hypothetical protein
MTAHSMITHARETLLDSDRIGQGARQQESADLRQRIDSLLRDIFEGHAEFLGCTPD